MGHVKRAALIVLGALSFLLALGFADGDRYRLMPSLFKNSRVGVLPESEADEVEIHNILFRFNRTLSVAYRTLDPSPLVSFPMDDGLRQSYIDELAYLRRGGRAMQITVADFRIEEVRRLPSELLSVRTAESVDLTYLRARDRTEIMSYPRTRYVMNYLLEPSGSGWKVVRTRTLKTEKHAG